MKYNILKDFAGSPDGCTVVQYVAGSTAELSASLAEVALAEGWAKEAMEDADKQATTETKEYPPARKRPRFGKE